MGVLADGVEIGIRRGNRIELHLLSSVWLGDHLSGGEKQPAWRAGGVECCRKATPL